MVHYELTLVIVYCIVYVLLSRLAHTLGYPLLDLLDALFDLGVDRSSLTLVGLRPWFFSPRARRFLTRYIILFCSTISNQII
jgi:hypothetical protein